MMFFNNLCILCSLFVVSVLTAVEIERKLWPTLKNVDIWNPVLKFIKNVDHSNLNKYDKRESANRSRNEIKQKRSKVFHLFPVPVGGECLSNDGRRIGTCLNVYECRQRGGLAKGECSLGFGVCCVFIAYCEQTILNNITYLVSPNFPSSMPSNFTSCKVKVKIMDSNISQLRIDFNHFSLGQPNRKTGICDGDVFNVSGGPTGDFVLCGQNSGQHIYYDVIRPLSNVESKLSSQNMNFPMENVSNHHAAVDITMKFINRFLPIRFWEIRIAQIPFSQRAPNNCLQYFLDPEGIIQTFNFADNGRHLANQHYRSCVRQEANMCSIMYQPCDDQSFKIGPTRATQIHNGMMESDFLVGANLPMEQLLTDSSDLSTNAELSGSSDAVPIDTTTDGTTAMEIEGSGGENSQLPIITSRRPVRGGFDILSFFRSAFSFKKFNRSARQFFTTCSDRITMPCIIEDFVGAGMGPLPGCEPVHCGNQFCALGTKPCRIESTVKPFYLGINFGNGIGKGSAEDNIGACIRYTQIKCI